MDTIKVGIIQQSIGADVEANKHKLAACIRDVAARGAQLVVLQELHNSLCHLHAVAQSHQIPGHQIPVLRIFAAILHPLGQDPELSHRQRTPHGIAQMAGQQQESPLRPGHL